jgi:hypothetical protein
MVFGETVTKFWNFSLLTGRAFIVLLIPAVHRRSIPSDLRAEKDGITCRKFPLRPPRFEGKNLHFLFSAGNHTLEPLEIKEV